MQSLIRPNWQGLQALLVGPSSYSSDTNCLIVWNTLEYFTSTNSESSSVRLETSFTKSKPLNDSFVWWEGNGFCGTGRSTNACATFHGGLYDNTSTSLDPAFSNSSTSLGSNYPPCQFVTDKMTLNVNTSLSNFSFGIAQKDMHEQGYHPQAGLGNGLSVRIPNNQLVVPDLSIDKTSGAVTYNYTDPDLLLLSLQSTNSDDMTTLGRNFFTSAYLMVNHDTSQYTLWAANATTEKALVAVDGNNQVYKDLCTVDTASPLSPSTTTTTTSSKSQNGLSSAEIAGIVVGSVAGVALVLGTLLFSNVRRKPKLNRWKLEAMDLMSRLLRPQHMLTFRSSLLKCIRMSSLGLSLNMSLLQRKIQCGQ
ncbi:hypothetical protein N7495_000741 [Penicillium taxi]|uniref:uncharacterized protein n=1 Tax=Penicillium taxi TaxID=168475 RepID=UPI0025450C27|nr:uncharacterized protein N7495_000741 [Penicillium taxi]KAJ5908059.1 hypothetical protein N7495_000741 [Penicillium taxi]